MSYNFFIDENLMPRLESSLAGLFPKHRFRHASTENLLGVEDVSLFDDLRQREFDAIITLDKQQLAKPSEYQKLAECGLHWIGFAHPSAGGLKAIAFQVATISMGLPFVLDSWNELPTAYRLHDLTLREPVMTPL